MTEEKPEGEPIEVHRVPRTGTVKMVSTIAAIPVVVFFLMWALVRATASPQVPTSEIIDLTCDTTDTETVFRGQLDPASLSNREFDEATLRVEFFGFLVREEGSQLVGPSDVNSETGMIDIEISQEIEGPASCEVISFLPVTPDP